MTTPDAALAAALDNLTTQVNPDNILAVHKVFSDQANALQRELKRLATDTKIGLCGGDPISIDAAAAFGGKVAALLEVHWAHQRELAVAAEHLQTVAKSYGFTEAEIERYLSPASRQ